MKGVRDSRLQLCLLALWSFGNVSMLANIGTHLKLCVRLMCGKMSSLFGILQNWMCGQIPDKLWLIAASDSRRHFLVVAKQQRPDLGPHYPVDVSASHNEWMYWLVACDFQPTTSGWRVKGEKVQLHTNFAFLALFRQRSKVQTIQKSKFHPSTLFLTDLTQVLKWVETRDVMITCMSPPPSQWLTHTCVEKTPLV